MCSFLFVCASKFPYKTFVGQDKSVIQPKIKIPGTMHHYTITKLILGVKYTYWEYITMLITTCNTNISLKKKKIN